MRNTETSSARGSGSRKVLMTKKRLGFDLILLGDSTSGKDTQALLLSKKYNVKLAGSGEYLRKFWSKQYVQGAAAPTKLIIPFLNQSLRNLNPSKNIIFVGAARLKPEAGYLVRQLIKRDRDFFVIYIRLPKAEIIKRSKLRASRPEDTDPALIKSRIKYYKEKVSKTVQFYKSLHKLKFINGNQTITKVHKDILKALNDYSRSRAD